MRLKRRLLALAASMASVVVLPLSAASPASAAPPTESCNIEHQARIIFWAVACAEPGEPVIGAFATWRNEPITFAQTDTSGTTVQAANYLTMMPNREGGLFSNYVQIGLFAEKTGATTSTYGPRWSELGENGGVTRAITQGAGGNTPDRTNHTYMLLRQDGGDQWDVLYDFNKVGTTTGQLPVPRGSANRLDIGLEVMGPQHLSIPRIDSRVQYMAENKTWYRTATEDVAQITSLPKCNDGGTAPYCFTAQLTGGASFEQWSTSKPGPTQLQTSPPTDTAPKNRSFTDAVPKVLNGVNQAALRHCLAEAPDTCLSTVPGLARCARTVQLCNAAAVSTASRPAFSQRSSTVAAEDIHQRAAVSFGVPVHKVQVNSGPGRSATDVHAEAGPVWTVESSAATHGLERRDRTFDGFRATYSASTDRLLHACWGQMCAR
ncbi:hypothetical protein LIX60_04585 [Streptomyces sp. S07_1.15]|uniref:hypothetical protein n=1 Tax=Streptomyces sp. S07_1.15 TaxID=2873925 RepID=UPI001D13B026|nr:hypothetical protein [Streptomyces sp. S07_1.15]MCC3650766.1 hypothetical protein [Streptomyces sp. S07_1.15]